MGLELGLNGKPVSRTALDVQRDAMRTITTVDDVALRSTKEYWSKRVGLGGPTGVYAWTDPDKVLAMTKRHLPFILDYCAANQIRPPQEVVEIGCGYGRMAKLISGISKSYIGVDFVPQLIEEAQAQHPDLTFVLADAKNTGLAPESCDVIVAITCLSSFAFEFPKFVAEFKRILRPNGHILFLEEDFVRIDFNEGERTS